MTLTPSCELEEIDMYLATNPKEDQGKGGEVALENPKVQDQMMEYSSDNDSEAKEKKLLVFL